MSLHVHQRAESVYIKKRSGSWIKLESDRNNLAFKIKVLNKTRGELRQSRDKIIYELNILQWNCVKANQNQQEKQNIRYDQLKNFQLTKDKCKIACVEQTRAITK